MTKESVRNHKEWRERLTQVGCPLNPEKDHTITSNESVLQITQLGHPVMENFVMEMPSGLTEYLLGVHIVCLAAKVYLEDFKLVVPWADPQILWLPDPEESGPDKMNYVMPESGDVYPSERVINHRIGTELRRGQRIQGWVLASSTTVLPDHIKHRSSAAVKFGVIDQYGRVHSEDFFLYVDRSRGSKTRGIGTSRIAEPPREEAEVRRPRTLLVEGRSKEAGRGASACK